MNKGFKDLHVDGLEPAGPPWVHIGQQPAVVVAEMVSAFAAANTPCRPDYVVYGGILTYITDSDAEALDPTALLQELGAVARAVTTNAQGEVRDAHWPTDALKAACAPRPAALRRLLPDGAPLPPEVRQIVRAPFIRNDGTICSAPGVDDQTGVLLVPDADLAGFRTPAPGDLVAVKAREAAKWIHDELLTEFPWSSAADLANTFAYLLTPLTRELFDLAPLFLVEASTKGSGKGLVTDLAAMIATGRDITSYVLPSEDAETRKLITSSLAAGDVIVRFDETRFVSGRSLQKLLTERHWSDRLLGGNTTGDWPNRVTWAATGNNPDVGGDMGRRICLIRLTPDTDRPHERIFNKPDLLGWIHDHRAETLGHLLTMVAAWAQLGRPAPAEPVVMGSYQQWADVMSGVLALAGVDGFMGNRDNISDVSDSDEADAAEILAAIHLRHGTMSFLVHEIVSDPKIPAPEWVAKAADNHARGTAWGKWLSQHRDRHVAGYKIRRGRTTSGERVYWSVDQVPPPPVVATGGGGDDDFEIF